ncbi:MAG TPA: hypothetical protein VMU28_05610 [Terriglobales bacterium]|nr:hypothetical protein [Terriglobales bacterium]
MPRHQFTTPEIAMIAGTRVALGMGIGMLLSGRLSRDQRKAAGVALLIVGAASTVPFVVSLVHSKAQPGDWNKAA